MVYYSPQTALLLPQENIISMVNTEKGNAGEVNGLHLYSHSILRVY
jgi:hypothetical protein